MSVIYESVLKRSGQSRRPDVITFYDENKEKVIKEMRKYCKKHGYSVQEADGEYSIMDIVLRKRRATGEVIEEVSYGKLFDVYGNRIKGGGE